MDFLILPFTKVINLSYRWCRGRQKTKQATCSRKHLCEKKLFPLRLTISNSKEPGIPWERIPFPAVGAYPC